MSTPVVSGGVTIRHRKRRTEPLYYLFLFPTLILGIFWRRASPAGALLAMVLGLGTSLGYYFLTHESFGGRVDLQLFGIQPVACGIFGVLAGLAAHVVVSLVGPAPSARQQALVDFLRRPS